MAKTCQKCLLTEKVEGIKMDENGLCNYCTGGKKDEWGVRFNVTEERKETLRMEMERYIEQIRGKHEYDCVLGLSGGKDSAYLIDVLLKEKKLKVLAVHINMPFENNIAYKNIEMLKEKYKFDLQIIDPDLNFWLRFYRTLFLNPVKEGYLKTVCNVCGPVFIGCCLKAATERKVPLVIMGYATNHPENMFFELDKNIIEKKDWIPELFKTDKFDEDFRDIFWNPFKYSEDTIFPRLLIPLHVMKYNANAIIEKLSKEGILPAKDLNPAVTNCDLNWPIMYLDINLLGYNPYLKEWSALVRKNEALRSYYHRFTVGDDVTKTGIVNKKVMEKIEKMLDIKFSECPTDTNKIARSLPEYP